MSHDDPSDPIEAWLRVAHAELPDEGFTDAVMRRVKVEERARSASLDAQRALERLRAHSDAERRQDRWRLLGAAAGSLLAVLWWAATSDRPADIAPAQAAALMAGLTVAAWWLTDGAAAQV